MDYISREDAITIVKWWFDVAGIRPDNVILSIKDLPAADVVERKKGKWLPHKDEDNEWSFGYECSECGGWYMLRYGETNFCPDSGAAIRQE